MRHALDEVVGATNIDLKDIPPSIRVLRRKGLKVRHTSQLRGYSCKKTRRTFIHRAKNTSVSNENIQFAKVSHGGSDHLFCPFHITHVGRESKHLCRGTLAKDRIFTCVEAWLSASHQ